MGDNIDFAADIPLSSVPRAAGGYVDLHYVEPHQYAIHDRLVNWARWCADRPTYWMAPMFRAFRTSDHWTGAEARTMVDQLDAQVVEKAVAALPVDHRVAVRWFYVLPWRAPTAIAREIGCSLMMLQRYVRDGRQMLLNRIPP